MSTPAAKNNRYRRVVNPNGNVSLAYSPHNKEALIMWARKFNKPVLNRLLAGSGASYEKRIRKIPNPPHTRTAFIKAIIAKYLLNRNSQLPPAVKAVNNFHRAAKHGGENRIPNARLVNFLSTMPSNQLARVHNSLPFYA
jgi:hypothetical protein